MSIMIVAEEAMRRALEATTLPQQQQKEHILSFLSRYCSDSTFSLVVGKDGIRMLKEDLITEPVVHFMFPVSYRFQCYLDASKGDYSNLITTMSHALAFDQEVTNRSGNQAFHIIPKIISEKLNSPTENQMLFEDNKILVALAVMNITGLGVKFMNAHKLGKGK